MANKKADLVTVRKVNIGFTADQHLFAGRFAEARRMYNRLLFSAPVNDYLLKGRILKKTGDSYNQQWRFNDAVSAYEKAEEALMKLPESEPMRNEWIELQIDYCYVLMHLRKVTWYEEKKERLKPVIEAHGSILQKGRYAYVVFTDLLWKNGWYMLPDETVIVCERIINLAQVENNLPVKLTAQNMLAFTYLFRHEFIKAREISFEILSHIREGEYAEEVLRAYCTICFCYRKENDLEKTRKWVRKAYGLADFNKNLTFRYLLDSISGWIYLKAGDLQKANYFAMTSYNGMSKHRYPFLAFSLIPLIAIHTKQNKIHKAIHFAFRMLVPNQQKVTDKINEPLKAAIRCWGNNDLKGARQFLEEAVKRADENGFL